MARLINFEEMQISVPDDATDDEVAQILSSLGTPVSPKKEFDTTLTTPEKIASAADVGMSAVGDFASKAIPRPLRPFLPSRQNIVDLAAGASGTMRGTAGLLGLGEGIWPTSAANKDSALRTTGEVLDPLALAIGGGVSKVIPIASLAGKGITEGGKLLAKNVASGTAAGGIVGGLSENGDATTGAAMGGGMMAGIPVVGKTWKGITGVGKDVIDTVLTAMGNKGANRRLSDKAILSAVPESQKEKVVAALLSQKPEVAGSNITVGQAIAGAQKDSPEVYGRNLVKLQHEVGGMPESEDVLATAIKQQKVARREAIGRDIAGGTDEAAQKTSLEGAEKLRAETADALYGKARASDIQRLESELEAALATHRNRGDMGVFKYIPKVDERIDALSKNSVFNSAAKKASGRMNGNDPRLSLDGLHLIKEEMDALYKSKKFSPRAISEAKAELLNAIEGTSNAPGISPTYGQAREAYAGMSPEVNRLKIGQALLNKLETPAGIEKRGAFLSTLGEGEDAFLRNKAGQMRGKGIEEHLTPEQLKTVSGVETELIRDTQMSNMLKDITGSTGIIPDEKLPTLLNRAAMATNFALGMMKADAKQKIALEVAKKLTRPEGVAELLAKPKSDPMSKVVNAMLRQNRLPVIAANQQGE